MAWDLTVPTGQAFADAMAQVEAILLNPASTHNDFALANDIATAINEMDSGCDDGDGGESGPPTGGSSPGGPPASVGPNNGKGAGGRGR